MPHLGTGTEVVEGIGLIVIGVLMSLNMRRILSFMSDPQRDARERYHRWKLSKLSRWNTIFWLCGWNAVAYVMGLRLLLGLQR
ncbi:MAG: hypothetical protein ACLQVD_16355 [Capsulimonadaceae bacterium]